MDKHISQNLVMLLSIYKECQFKYSDPHKEAESDEYEAYELMVNGSHIKYRTAKITPTKTGQFVTLWKRSEGGPIEPYSANDPIDFVVIATVNGNQCGHFVFPKSALIKQGIVTSGKREGKRGFRVYPPWDQASSPQALKTQKWQLEFFLGISVDGSFDKIRAQKLYSPPSKLPK